MAEITVPSELDVLEGLVDLVRQLAQSSPQEAIRRAADDLQHADHKRRNAAKGLHPLAGQTKEDYEAYMADHSERTGGAGRHGVTGETASDYAENGWKWGAEKQVSKPEPSVPVHAQRRA